ncbi:DEAD/DEAH box helicase [Ideonella sp. BN130291]|uniref:DEAD/DEAH box helicase n=1 Tax=Ideonella sp. BN130291 TaxID=3112940 RepID=UPI002E2725C5|nr:DEAD/DEAH box helicase [Ideonella sp. BN130291]
MSFTSLGLSPALLRAVRERGHAEPTAVQAAAIPAALAGRDLVACAHTGSGKTAAFVLPLLQRLQGPARQRGWALVLVPTRELAVQVGETVHGFARHLPQPLKVVTAVGGVSINPQLMRLRGGADVVVATPGRLLDLVDHNALDLRRVALLVLDEADRLLDSGFADELRRVMSLLPARRQTLMFSATFPAAVTALAQTLLNQPVRVDVPEQPAAEPAPEAAAAEEGTPATAHTLAAIEQHAVQVDAPRRTQLLAHMLRAGDWSRVLVFVATQYATEHVADKLRRQGISAAAFHGDLGQRTRSQVLADFQDARLQVLVATDLAARGIHVEGLPVVVNYDLPRSPVDHVHRIGRTGRAGARGLAVSFVSADTEAHFRLIEKRQGQRVPREQIAGFEPTEAPPERPAAGGVKGQRKSKKDKLREAAARSRDNPA